MWFPFLTLVSATFATHLAGAAVAGGDVAEGGDLTAGWTQQGAKGGEGLPVTQLPHDPSKKRGRRKVISRGGHYIVWSRGGTSPWSSTTYDAGSSQGSGSRSYREYSWHPQGESVGDGGLQGYVGPQGRSSGAGTIARKKLNQSFKREIAQYAMVYGVRQAAVHYEHAVGRRLRDRVVAKFVRRYQDRKMRKRRRRRRRLGQT